MTTPQFRVNGLDMTPDELPYVLQEDGTHKLTLPADTLYAPDQEVSGEGPTLEIAVANLNKQLPDSYQVVIHIPF